MGLLDGKVALITGAARGQGRAHAMTCAREGADVIITDISHQIDTVPYDLASRDDLDETAELVKATGKVPLVMEADVRDQRALDEAVRKGLEKFGQIDMLIANAGIWGLAPFWELTEAQWGDMIDVNLTGVWRSAKAVAPHMIERRSGSIVAIASVNSYEPGENFTHYTAAKHGVLGLVKNLAAELAPHGVRCNAVSPGAVMTPMLNNPMARDMFAGHPGGTEADVVEGGRHFHLLRGVSMLDPQSIADAALYLNSDLASTVTGISVPVEAGHLLIRGNNPDPSA
jgi:SDR family mycofactocin-dependent oxidoreductase